MAGYWSCSLSVSLWTLTLSGSINMPKKELWQYQAILPLCLVNNSFLVEKAPRSWNHWVSGWNWEVNNPPNDFHTGLMKRLRNIRMRQQLWHFVSLRPKTCVVQHVFWGASGFKVWNLIQWTGHFAIYVHWLLGWRYISSPQSADKS